MLDNLRFWYTLIVGISGPIIIIFVNHIIKNIASINRYNVKRKKIFKAINVKTPDEDYMQQTKKNAIKNINSRFTIIKSSAIVSLIIIWLLLLSAPFLSYIPATVISIFVGSSGIIIGIVARPIIENMISGILISVTKPFSIGDTIEINAVYGTVEDITLTNTIIKIWDRNRYIVPNSKMINSEFINYTLNQSSMWAKIEFRVSYECDINLITELAKESAMESDYTVGEDGPNFWIVDLDELSYKCWITAWVISPSEAWALRHDVRKNLIKKFKENGISSHFYNFASKKGEVYTSVN